MSIFSLRILLLFFQTIDSDLYICKLHQDRYPFVQNKVMAHLKTLFSSKLIFMSQPILLLQHVNQSNRLKEEKTADFEYFILKYLSLKKYFSSNISINAFVFYLKPLLLIHSLPFQNIQECITSLGPRTLKNRKTMLNISLSTGRSTISQNHEVLPKKTDDCCILSFHFNSIKLDF